MDGSARQHEELDLLTGGPVIEASTQRAFGAAASSVPILVLGEPGTGRSRLARAIHLRSGREPLVELDCRSLPSEVIEQQLAGVVRGASGQQETVRGLIERAHGGTLLLRGVEALPLSAQSHVIELLRHSVVTPCGCAVSVDVDVRLLLTAERRLSSLASTGRLRREFLDNVSALCVDLPSMAERRSDLPYLVHRVLLSLSREFSIPLPEISDEALDRLARASYPENLRTLRGALQLAMSRARGRTIEPDDFPEWLEIGDPQADPRGGLMLPSVLVSLPYREAKERAIDSFEIAYFSVLLDRAEGNVSEAARQAGLDRSNFRRALRRAQLRLNRNRDRVASPAWTRPGLEARHAQSGLSSHGPGSPHQSGSSEAQSESGAEAPSEEDPEGSDALEGPERSDRGISDRGMAGNR